MELKDCGIIRKGDFMFNIGSIIELKQDILMYDKGLICQVVSIDEDNSHYGYVKILRYDDGKLGKGEIKHANLTLFKLLSEKGGFYV